MEQVKWRGVNLGGWLVLERWITPGLFKNTTARDEQSLCTELGERKDEILAAHRREFVTKADFEWIRSTGLNAVRIPVGYWFFGDSPPYEPTLEYLDAAFTWARAIGIGILIDLHGAPGSQNGEDHSGKAGKTDWHNDSQHQAETLATVKKLAERYGSNPALLGLSVLNEPSRSIPAPMLQDFYENCYRVIRQIADKKVAMVISDRFEPQNWKNTMKEQEYQNVLLDLHLYQVFTEQERKMDVHRHIKKVRHEWQPMLKSLNRPAVIGEWSVALDKRSLRGLDEFERDKALQAYCRAQLETFQLASGWFYWTYKTEDKGAWSFRYAYQKGWVTLES